MEQVEKGYKQTEIGVIPEDWEVKVFQDFADKKIKWSITGGPFGSNLKASDYTNEGVRIIQLQNIGDGVFWDDYKIYTSERKADELLSCNIYPNEIIISKMGDPVARACMIPEIEKRYLMASDGIRLVINEKEYDKRFAFFYINSIYFRKRAFEVSMGSTRLRIGLPQLKHLSVIKPPKEEQTAIATALSEADSYIQSLEQVIEKKRLIKKGAMQELLTGKKRLKGFEGTSKYKQTEIGVIPEDWIIKTLGEIGENIIGLTYSPNDVKDYGHLVLRSSNIQNNKLSFENNVFVQMELPERVIVKENDILICVRNGSKHLIGKCALIDKKTEGSAFGAFMSIYRTDYSNYIFHQFQSNIIQKQIDEVMGATINQLTNKDLATFQIPIPPSIEEQTAIATNLSNIDNEIEILEQKLEKANQIKQGMMQQLLTGKIRLV